MFQVYNKASDAHRIKIILNKVIRWNKFKDVNDGRVTRKFILEFYRVVLGAIRLVRGRSRAFRQFAYPLRYRFYV